MESQPDQTTSITQEQIRECIAILDTLNKDTNQIFEIPKDE
ncbi:MAG: hypothetical protein ACJAR3_001625, partial [Roseivirga sp.]